MVDGGGVGLLVSDVGVLSHLTHLGLSGNRLTGVPCDAIGQLSALQSLQLDHNNISQPWCSEISQLRNLSEL